MAPKPKCIIILSTKSAGSSALQELICKFAGGQHVEHTRHKEQETLYWTKAASMLDLPQVKLPDSEVPIPAIKAERQLRQFLTANVADLSLPTDSMGLVVEGWRALTSRYAPVFVEKSPHHLHQWSCLQLMLDTAAKLPDLDFRFVGLIRNPMDVLYSAWTRWRIRPEDFEQHWRMAYENLERMKSLAGDRLTTVRYEDFSAQSETAENFLSSLGLVSISVDANKYIHGSSRLKWKADSRYGFQLSPAVEAIAKRFNYTSDQLQNRERAGWRLYSALTRCGHQIYRQPFIRARRMIRSLA